MKRSLAILLVLVAGCGKKEPQYLKEYEALAAKQPELLAEAKKLGIPVEFEDLKGKPTVPREQNAAYDYLSIDKAYLQSDFGTPLGSMLNTKGAKRDVKGSEWQLYTLTPLIKIADRAVSKPYCQFEHDWSKGCAVLSPEHGILKTIAKIYASQAVYCALKGDKSGFRSSIKKAFAVEGHLSESPSIMPMLVRVGIKSRINDAIRIILTEGKHQEELAKGLRQIILSTAKPLDFNRQFLTEATIARMSILRFIKPMKDERDLDQYLSEMSKLEITLKSTDSIRKSVGILDPVARNANDARFLQFLIYAKKVLDSRPTVEAASELENQFDLEIVDGRACSFVLETAFGGDWRIAALSALRSRSIQAVTLGLLEAFDFRREHGAFPAKITQIDPFDGKPLDYQRTANGFNIASRFGPIKTKYGLFPKEPETESQKRLLHFEYKNRP